MLKKLAVTRPPCLLALCLLAAMVCGSAQPEPAVPAVETIVARMAQARARNEALFRPYVVTRDYTLFGKERRTIKSQVIADVTFVPPHSKKYAIQQAQGIGLGERIVRRMLEGEADITNDAATSLSYENYDFRFVREEEVAGHRCYVLELLPKRRDKNLLRGNIWVDTGTYLLHRTDGEPAKSPSWWLRDAHITFVYGDVGGMWLQTASESTANVRILGQHTMVSRDVGYKIGEQAASQSTLEEGALWKPSGWRGGILAFDSYSGTFPSEQPPASKGSTMQEVRELLRGRSHQSPRRRIAAFVPLLRRQQLSRSAGGTQTDFRTSTDTRRVMVKRSK